MLWVVHEGKVDFSSNSRTTTGSLDFNTLRNMNIFAPGPAGRANKYCIVCHVQSRRTCLCLEAVIEGDCCTYPDSGVVMECETVFDSLHSDDENALGICPEYGPPSLDAWSEYSYGGTGGLGDHGLMVNKLLNSSPNCIQRRRTHR